MDRQGICTCIQLRSAEQSLAASGVQMLSKYADSVRGLCHICLINKGYCRLRVAAIPQNKVKLIFADRKGIACVNCQIPIFLCFDSASEPQSLFVLGQVLEPSLPLSSVQLLGSGSLSHPQPRVSSSSIRPCLTRSANDARHFADV